MKGTVVWSLSHVWLFYDPMGCIARQAPLSMEFPGKYTEVGRHFLLRGIFPPQGLDPHLLHWQVDSWPLSHQGSPSQRHVHILVKEEGQSKDGTTSHFCKKKKSLFKPYPAHMYRLPLMSQRPGHYTPSCKKVWENEKMINLDQSWPNVCWWADCCHKENFHLVIRRIPSLINRYTGCLVKFDFLTKKKKWFF